MIKRKDVIVASQVHHLSIFACYLCGKEFKESEDEVEVHSHLVIAHRLREKNILLEKGYDVINVRFKRII